MTVLRLGAAQLHYHPAFVGGGQQPLCEPLGTWEGAGLSGLGATTEEGQQILRALRERVEKVYVEAFRPRLLAVVRFAAALELDLLVLPELSVPLALLPAVAEAAGERMTVVAGTHTVTREGVRAGVYEALAFPGKPAIGSAVAPVLRGGKAVGAQAKLAASRWEADLVPGKAWAPVPVGGVDVGILICIDFLKRADGDVAPLVATGLDRCAVVAVPSLSPFASLVHFERGAEEALYGYERVVVYANGAGEGGTRVFTQEEAAAVPLAAGRAPVLPKGVEGVVAVEVRLGEAKQRYKPVAASRPLAAAVVMDAGVWGELREAEEGVLAAGEVGEALDRVEGARRIFERARSKTSGLPDVGRERWRYLAGGAEGTTSLAHLRALARDVWMEGIPGWREIQKALLDGATTVLHEVERTGDAPQRMVSVRGWLETQARERFEDVEAPGELVAAVTEGLLPDVEEAPPPEPADDGSFESWVREPGPFPARLRRAGLRGWTWNEVRSGSYEEDVVFSVKDLMEGRRPYETYFQGVGYDPEDLSRAAAILALEEGPPAWLAVDGSRHVFVLRDGRVVPPNTEHQAAAIRKLARHDSHLGALAASVRSEAGRRFVAPAARLRGGEGGPALALVERWIRGHAPLCLLLGEFGVGKSTVSARFAAQLAWAALHDGDAPSVVFVDLRAWSGQVTLHGLVRRALGVSNVAPYRFAVEEGECVLILDGFDEMSNRFAPAQLGGALRALLAWRTERSKILLTCRTHLFIDPADLDRVFAEVTGATLKTPGLGEIAGATVIELQLFDEKRIREYLAHVSKEPERAWEAMGKVHDLRNLAERPLLLDMIRENLPALTREEAVSLGDLYESYVQKWAEWAGTEEHLRPDEKIAFAEVLARCIWNGEQGVDGDSVHWRTLGVIFLRELPESRLRSLDNLEAALLELRGGSFVVWSDAEGGGRYRFAHRSFYEYLVARQVVRRLGVGDRGALDLPRFSPEVIAYCKGRPGWVAARAEAAAILVEPYRARVSENALLLVVGEQGSGSSAETPWRLEGAKLAQSKLRAARLAGAWLMGGDLAGATLAEADLRGARIEGAVLDGADLGHADFREAVMKGATARGATLDGTRFEGADLREVALEESSAFAEAPVLAGARLDGARVAGTAWRAPAPGVELYGLVEVGEARWRADAAGRVEDPTGPARVEPAWHQGNVNGVTFSPDGTRVATACDRIVRIWGARTGRLLLTLEGHKNQVTSMAWTADGERLCTASHAGTPRVWEARTGRLLLTLEGHKKLITSTAWTADGERICTGSYDDAARVWEARTGQLLLTLEGHKNQVTSMAWTADGERLCTGSRDCTARVWEARTGRLLLTLEGHTNGVTSVAWTADGERLCTGSDDRTARVWEARTGRLLLTLEGHKDMVTSVAWTADGERLCTGSRDATARVWEARTGRLLLTLEGHKDMVTSVAWTADGERLCTGSHDATARMWDVATARELAAFLHTPAGGVARSGAYVLPSGAFDVSAFTVRIGAACAPLPLYADLCLRPDLVAASLAGQPVPPLHVPMDTASRMVEAAVDALLGQHEAERPPPVRSGPRKTIPFPWKLSPAILAASGFNWRVDILSPAGAFQPVQAQLGHALWLPELAPGDHKLVLTLEIGDRALGNHHERRYTAPLTVLSHNPYIAGPPVRGADLIGRAPDLSRILDKLSRGSIQLTGERRIGKTSLLHALLDHPGPFAPIWLDAQDLPDPAAFRTWVTAAVRHHLPDAPADPADLLSYLRRLADSGRPPLLLVDEISHLQGLTARDAAWLRSLSTPPIAAVLAGSPFDWTRFLASLPDAAGSPFNHLQHVTIGPLTDHEMRNLVTRPGTVAPDDDAMRRILDLSGGRPYLAQLLCQAALDRVQRDERLSISFTDVDATARDALVTGLHHQHTKRWAELAGAPEVQRALVEHACAPQEGAAAPRSLHDALREHGLFDGLAWTVDPAFLMWVKEREG